MLKIQNTTLKKIIKHAETYGFLNFVENNNILNHFKFGPAGELLSENIRKEWVYSNVINRENNVFLFNSGGESGLLPDLREAFLSVKTFTNSELPFGLADIRKLCVTKDNIELNQGEPQKYTGLKYYAFVPQAEAEQFFYRFQQQRKRWWRKFFYALMKSLTFPTFWYQYPHFEITKFSLVPGKFSFAEVKEKDIGVKLSTKIVAEFPWGVHTLETINYFGDQPFESLDAKDYNIFSVHFQRKRNFPHLVVCDINLDYATFSYICDAFTTERGKIVLKFHRKLAPFKFTFAASPCDDEDNKNLFEVAELICLGLRKSGLFTLLPAKGEFAKKELNSQLLKSDALGIPYTAVLSKETLNTGIFGLYSRDTTLQEQVHISKINDYGELLMKNY